MCSEKILVYNKTSLIYNQGQPLSKSRTVATDIGLGNTSYKAVPRVKATLWFHETILVTPTKQHVACVETTPTVTALVVGHYMDVSVVITAGSF